MPKLTIEKSILINAPLDKVYGAVRDFRQWPTWSPWLIADPQCRVTYADDGRSYSWSGPIVGSGQMEVISEEKPRAIHYRLTFFKPWKSVSAVDFRFTDRNGAVEAAWSMDGTLPFFLFWMKGMMTAFVGLDYERGLKMLKDYLETGSVPSKLEFLGQRSVPAFAYVGVRSSCAVSDVGPRMEEDFGRLKAHAKELQPSGHPFAIYHSWDPVRGRTEYTIGFPVVAPPPQVPPGLTTGAHPACQAYVVKHVGPYRHLGNPWAAGMMHSRAKAFKPDRKVAMFETYENDPQTTPETDLITLVHLPARLVIR